jgi:exosortase A
MSEADSATATAPGPRPAWRPALLALALLAAGALGLYWDTAWAMVSIWTRSGTYTHDFLVLPIVGWLIWRQRAALRWREPTPSFWSLLPLAVMALAWLLGQLAAVNALTQFALVAFLVLAVPAILGVRIAGLLIFPLAFMFFAVPMGEFLVNQLMEWTANVTVLALRLSGVPVYREGMQFVIPSGTWSVVEACSGVRYLIASVTVGALFAYLNYRSPRRRAMFMVVSVVVPIIANWMRAYMIVMIGHLSSNQLATGVDHLVYGWLFFGIIILLMFVIGARWAEQEDAPTVVPPPSGAAPAPRRLGKLAAVTMLFAVLLAVPRLVLYQMERQPTPDTAGWAAPATLAGGWRLDPAGGAGFKPAFQNPSAEFDASYSDGRGTVGLYLGFYNHQNYQRKMISSGNVLVTSGDTQWAMAAQGSRQARFGDTEARVRTAEIRGSGVAEYGTDRRLVAWQVYWINGALTTSDYLAKAYSALNRLAGRGDDCAVIVVYAPKSQDGLAEVALESFLASNYPAIAQMLQARRLAQ